MLITLYAKKEITNDPVLIRHNPLAAKKTFDTVIYKEPECKTVKARFRWDKKQPFGNIVTLNCWNFSLEWIK